MSLRSVAELALRQSWRGATGWTVGVAAVTVLYATSYSSVGKAKSDVVKDYPETLKRALNLQDLTSAAGYLGATVFGVLLLLLVTIYVIGAATRAVAADEESGVLDLVLSYPVSRTSLVLGRMSAMVAVLTAMGSAVFIALVLVRRPAGLTISVANLAATSLMWVLLGGCLGSISLLISAATGHRTATIAISAGVAVVAYLADTFLPIIDHLGWIRTMSPYHWFENGHPLNNGAQPRGCALLIVTSLIALAAACVVVNRRDIRV